MTPCAVLEALDPLVSNKNGMPVNIVRKDGRYAVFNQGSYFGEIQLSKNPFHEQNIYLNLNLKEYDPIMAPELFVQLKAELNRPLQVMLYSDEDEQINFLTAGGFQCRRRCYEVEGSAQDLIAPVEEETILREVEKEDSIWLFCGQLLYRYYKDTHSGVNPLTVDEEMFCRELPQRVLYSGEGACIYHTAFIDENEIAYVSTVCPEKFAAFAHSVLARLFRSESAVCFECDDCDPAAMSLRSMFKRPNEVSYDTYILD